jgi:hypothetical protein
MREILFKAKRADGKGWTVGHYTQEWREVSGGDYPSDVLFHFIYPPAEGYVCEPEPVEVDPKTVCQLSGARDITGASLWEKDIVLFDHGDGRKTKCRVQWSDFECAWILVPIEGTGGPALLGPRVLHVRKTGNIFDGGSDE